ncbi:exopolysaccharide biosynthesis polyprenyl glycosylphosphotransferase [Hirschia litorea]|uniref:Exopolysaccharide biosynthesis polyprenyl glycosylphosphotransferase n=1 Tax=Hirschia litorea TaxID=1199156 RepID=A0ABW2IGP2_9PROT
MSLDTTDPDKSAKRDNYHVAKLRQFRNSETNTSKNSSLKPSKRFPIDRSGLRFILRSVDFVFGLALIIISSKLLNLDLLNQTLRTSLPYIAAPIIAFLGMRIGGAYRFTFNEHPLMHLCRVLWGAGLGLGVVLALSWFFKLGGEPRNLFEICAIVLLAYIGLHAHYMAMIRSLTRSGALADNVVVIGATPAAYDLIERNQEKREMNILGVFEDRLDRTPSTISNVPVLGKIDDLLKWDKLPEVDRIILTVTSTAQDRVRTLIDRLRLLPQEVILVLDLDGFSPEKTSIADIIDMPAAYVSGAPKDARRAAVKRCSDIGVALSMLILFFPFMLIIAALIKLDSKGPIFFRQKRHGFNNQIIRVWKFRTMRPDSAAEEGIKVVQTVSNDERVTRIGNFLRRTSLDELPQLINILTGDMSLVGPRPHAVGMTTEEVEVHNIVAEYAHRHRMKPGLTGWAQINGSRGPVHTAELVKERVRLDMEYMEKASFWFDLYVILMTAPCLLGDTKTMR